MPITSVYDRARLDSTLRVQYGVVSRGQLVECGMNDIVLRHLLRKQGGWQIMLPGIYLTMRGEATIDQRDMAALLYAGRGSVITGSAAVWRHGLPCGDLDAVDVLIPADAHRKSTGFVRIQRTTRMPATHRTEGKIRFAYLPRAVGDAARGMRDFRDVQALVCATVQRTRVTVPHLITELNDGPAAGTRLFRAALAEVSEGVRSNAEADLKKLIDRSDIEKPIYNPKLYLPDGTPLCSPDLWWERHGVVGEVDSLAFHFKAKDYENTTKRHNRIERAGVHLLHWLPSTIKNEPNAVLRDIRATLATATSPPTKLITVPAGEEPPSWIQAKNGR
jgi:hypothetical protein